MSDEPVTVTVRISVALKRRIDAIAARDGTSITRALHGVVIEGLRVDDRRELHRDTLGLDRYDSDLLDQIEREAAGG